jgi:competence protein ComGC
MKNESGFTLIEMLIVLLIISILLLLAIPNITKHNETINNKGCEALEELVESQVQFYKMDTGNYPNDLDELVSKKYIKSYQCPNGVYLQLGADGSVYVPSEN